MARYLSLIQFTDQGIKSLGDSTQRAERFRQAVKAAGGDVEATYWALGAKPWETDPTIEQREMGHACEWETSMILRLAPSLVGDYRSAPPVDMSASFAPATRGWLTKDRTQPGHIGAPHLATPEKGETLFRVFADDVVRLLERVISWDGVSWKSQ